MTLMPKSVGFLIAGGSLGLAFVVASGGALLSWAEGTGFVDGLALAFSTVSTTGFGPGPQTTGGTFLVFGVFAVGAACWFAILVAAFELGLRRYRAPVNGAGRTVAVRDAWPPSIVTKGRG